jgi:hypothetical protein
LKGKAEPEKKDLQNLSIKTVPAEISPLLKLIVLLFPKNLQRVNYLVMKKVRLQEQRLKQSLENLNSQKAGQFC